ncbi:phage/plasmid primase, P4 family [Pseudooceanicola nitratireducens]|uniref:phage/plasmid primase, P4 family n=1 Tax=Pseudooceanicola nitratireducens TaxID=517719 RepID=UPI001C940E9C|nr:phage/plasmid primase, P4 family [Pseudooceanicola nitratireducens]MBY6155924.1 primase C-terminal domain-containing protein [Pseudooceanicola nitratireducens]
MPDLPVNIPVAPTALIKEMAKSSAPRSPTNNDMRPGTFMHEGKRNNSLASLAGSARRLGANQEEIYAILMAATQTTNAPLSETEVEQVARSISSYPPANDDIPFDDIPLSGVAARKLASSFCLTSATGWMFFDGKRWVQEGASARVAEAIKELLKNLHLSVVASGDVERIKIAKSLLSASRVKRINELVASAPGVFRNLAEFDAPGPLLNLQNGVLNLDLMELQPHDPAHCFTKLANVAYDPDATCPTFDRFVDDIMPKETQNFLMRLFGYALLGNPTRQVFTIVHGGGSNGKSTLINIVEHIFGDYARSAEPSTFIRQRNERVRDDLARLKGARMVATSELATGEILDAALVKRLTGGDTITARSLYKEAFEFKPQFTLFMVTNALPVIDGGDSALARRLVLVPFEATIQNRDASLPDRLRAEASGIFNRILAGLADYRENGLKVPESVSHAAERYAAESDLIAAFLEDQCELIDTASCGSSDLYRSYRNWCRNSGYSQMSQNIFRQEIIKRTGIAPKRTSKGMVWPGIGLLPRPFDLMAV